MFYDTASSANLTSLYICLARMVLGRTPLTPCFVQGNRTPTCPTALATVREQWLTVAAGFMSSILGCGVTATPGYCH